MSIKILVTGASGQLGMTFKDLAESYKNQIEFQFYSKNQLDITRESDLELVFNSKEFDYCINCAAYTNVEQSEKTPSIVYKINAEAVKKIALQCKKTNVVLIQISTDYVFDGTKNSPYLVNDAVNPINEYGKSKLHGENYIQDILKSFYIVRTSWLYSKRYGNNFYRFVLEQARSGKKIAITTEQLGCPTDTVDLAIFILEKLIIKKSKIGLYHFSGDNPMTWYDFAKEILLENNLFDENILEPTKNYPTRAKRPRYSVLR